MSNEQTTQALEDNALPHRVIAYLCVKYGGATLPMPMDFDKDMLYTTLINMGAKLEEYQWAALDAYNVLEDAIDFDLMAENTQEDGSVNFPVSDFISKSREILQA